MKPTIPTRVTALPALPVLLALLGLALLLAGCGTPTGTGSDDANSKAKDQFLAERGSGATPGVVTDTLTPRAGNPDVDLDHRVVIGKVTEINGNKVVVDNPVEQVQTTLTVKDNARIVKQ